MLREVEIVGFDWPPVVDVHSYEVACQIQRRIAERHESEVAVNGEAVVVQEIDHAVGNVYCRLEVGGSRVEVVEIRGN